MMSTTSKSTNEKNFDTLNTVRSAPSKAEEGITTHPHAAPVDKALAFLETAGSVEYTPEQLKALKWKIDLHLMPLLMIVQFFNFLDKTAISYANLFEFQAATGMHGQQFAWLGSLFYLGYLAWQPVAAWLLVRVPVKWHLGLVVFIWGFFIVLTAACKNFAGLAVCRFLLGCAESGMVPILGTITGMWYTRAEVATRVGLWFGSIGASQIIGGLIAYGMFQLETSTIEKWQFIFVLLGPITMLHGIVLMIFLPSSPATASFLTPEERVMAIERIRSNKTGTVAQGIKPRQIFEALRDPRLYIVCLAVFASSVPNGGISSFGATIVKGFGFTTKESTLLGMSTGGSETVAMVAGVLLACFTGMRGLPAAICTSVAVMGAAMMVGIPTVHKEARYAGYVLIFWFPVGEMLLVGWIQSMVAGHTKRTTFYCFYQVGYAVGNVVGAQIYREKDAPDYLPAKTVVLAFLAVHCCCFLVITAIHARWNKQRDAQEAITPTEVVENEEFMDMTDYEMKSFRYPL